MMHQIEAERACSNHKFQESMARWPDRWPGAIFIVQNACTLYHYTTMVGDNYTVTMVATIQLDTLIQLAGWIDRATRRRG